METKTVIINRNIGWNWIGFFLGVVVGGIGTLAMLALICFAQNSHK